MAETRKTSAAKTAETVKEEPKAPDLNTLMVKVRLFKDDEKYKDDLVVGYNGKLWQIQRGVEVEVPYPVAEIIRNSEKADEETRKKVAETASKYEESLRSR